MLASQPGRKSLAPLEGDLARDAAACCEGIWRFLLLDAGHKGPKAPCDLKEEGKDDDGRVISRGIFDAAERLHHRKEETAMGCACSSEKRPPPQQCERGRRAETSASRSPSLPPWHASRSPSPFGLL